MASAAMIQGKTIGLYTVEVADNKLQLSGLSGQFLCGGRDDAAVTAAAERAAQNTGRTVEDHR